MSLTMLLVITAAYFSVLLAINYWVSQKRGARAFYDGDKSSPWPLVAYGMIGASLSGVTFLSVPGLVGAKGFSYMQMVLGYQVGYLLIAWVLIPRFYNQKVVSIYQYLETTIGMEARLVGALSFLASRVIGSAFRLFLVVLLLQHFVLDPLHIPIEVTVIITLLLIFAYTATGGVKTLVYTDTLQTSVMLICAGVTLYLLARELGDFSALQVSVSQTTFDFGGFKNNDNHFVKQFLGGALLAFCMTGLDQDMMQKNLTCKDSISGQKNIITLSLLLIPINLLFLGLGYYLSTFAQEANLLVGRPDHLFPTVIFSSGTFSAALGGLFVLGLIAAALSSADSALTSLTTCFQVDILQDKTFSAKKRLLIHGSFALLLAAIILGFYYAPNGESIINRIFTVAQYTYGPLLGLFLFAMSPKRKAKVIYIPIFCMLTIGLTFWCQHLLTQYLNFSPGFLLLGINGTIMFSLLVITSTKNLSYEK